MLLVLFLYLCALVDSQHFYVYDWPDLVNRYANSSDRDHSHHGVEIPSWKENHGLGRLIDSNNMQYKTSQFSLFKIMYERALIDPRRVLDPTQADSFLIPYDFGMDAAFLESNGRMRRTNCPLSKDILHRLQNSPHFKAKNGHDHTLIVGINQNMNYYFAAKGCQDVFQMCWNCTKLSIDEYLFVAEDRTHELQHLGVNWHAVPFPSDYHYDNSNKSVVAPWQRNNEPRPFVVSFTGNARRYNEVATLIREALVLQCDEHPSTCVKSSYHDKKNTNPMQLSRQSIFCLQPPGDMPTRKSLFDAVLSGCIPVIFHPLTARFMYEWHFGQKLWSDIGIHFDTYRENQLLLNQTVDYIQKLEDIVKNEPHIVKDKRQLIRDRAYEIQYSRIIKDETRKTSVTATIPGHQDAYEISMLKVLKIHMGLEKHDRISDFIVCQHVLGHKGVKLLTTNWCNQTNSIKDPYFPSSSSSPLYKIV